MNLYGVRIKGQMEGFTINSNSSITEVINQADNVTKHDGRQVEAVYALNDLSAYGKSTIGRRD